MFAIIAASIVTVTAGDLLVIYLPLLGTERNIDAHHIGMLLLVRSLSALVARAFYARLIFMVGRLRLTLSSTFIASGAFVLLAVPSLPVMYAATVLIGVGLGIASTLTLSGIVEVAPVEARGTAMTLRITGNRIGLVLYAVRRWRGRGRHRGRGHPVSHRINLGNLGSGAEAEPAEIGVRIARSDSRLFNGAMIGSAVVYPIRDPCTMAHQRLQTIGDLVRRFQREQRGNITILFTLLLVPMMGFVGAAVDYSRANAVKAALQASLDATALMLAKTAGVQTSDELTTLGQSLFNAQFTRADANTPKLTVNYTPGSSTIVLNGSASVATTFLRILGFENLKVDSSAMATWGAKSRLRVALVLDNTGSMADAGKMPALKIAAKNLLSKLQSAATNNGDVYVSIVPFTKDVNVGSGNWNQSWVRWDLWDTANPGGSHSNWNGCVTDRDQDYDTTSTAAFAQRPRNAVPGRAIQRLSGGRAADDL